jgi:hypothetical protein
MSTDPGEVKVEPEIRRRSSAERFSKKNRKKKKPIPKADQKRTGQEKKS